ncbi:uncharacterized protein CTRU02_204625 [Colletotrichum truncatum]|uniref:Uncharacterized protein n=1 Tax=Colletotrichum truncatum TaxID=5467 RepID=A0ACC3ZCL3_COLTU|nr:uncharacterized protein CTRU02_02855 [Colletotrichum truncatum]KAF6797813.1 hypothetical protein CTRU02_02855 [Colletotrichum truncatum]
MSAISAARITHTALRSPLQRSALSTTSHSRSATAGPRKNTNGNKPEDIEIPAFSIRHVTSSPRGRFWLMSGFCVLATIEGYGWYNFGPKILRWEKTDEEK